MEIEEFIALLRERPDYQGQIVHVERQGAREARYADSPRRSRLPSPRRSRRWGAGAHTHQAAASRPPAASTSW